MADDRSAPPPFPSFDSAYVGTPPWEIGHPQPALAALFDAGEVSGRVLDVGCGTGELALLAAARGLEATGVDSAPRAIAIARRHATERGIAGVTFEVGDALDLGFLGTSFDTVLDSGVFHVFADDDRSRYVESIRRALVPGGVYHLLVFSDAQPGDWGPRRITRAELDAAFARGWQLRAVVPATLEVNVEDGIMQGWRTTAVRT